MSRTATDLVARPHLAGGRIDLSWRNPAAAEFALAAPFSGIRIVRRERSFARDEDDGDVIYDGPVVSRFSDRTVAPLRSYYYVVYAVEASLPPQYLADDGARAAAFATRDYGIARRLYELLPGVHRQFDTLDLSGLAPDVLVALSRLPAPLRGRGPLFRFLHAAAPFDLVRSSAEGLREVHDIDRARPEFLEPLGRFIGWEIDRSAAVFQQRNEIRFAPALYRRVGSVPSLRSLVTRYTGWHVQVAEFAQQVFRSNRPPCLSVFAVARRDGTFRAVDDAALALGFGAPNDEAVGGASTSAALTGALSAPFALAPDMRLALSVDGRLPFSVLFQSPDFEDITNATAAEVAAVINSVTTELTARALPTGELELSAHSVGPGSALAISRRRASLVTLEGAPRGRLSAFSQSDGRSRLFYETYEPEAPLLDLAATRALAGMRAPRPIAGGSDVAQAGSVTSVAKPLGRIRYKTRRGGVWGESLPFTDLESRAQGSPGACVLGDGRVFVVWVAEPHTPESRVRFRLGVPRAVSAARLVGRHAAPFVLEAGARLRLSGDFGEPEIVEFASLDFATPGQASALEVAAALNSRSSRVSAVALPDGTLELTRASSSGDAWLSVELGGSAAQVLGFGADNHTARADWGDEIDWSEAADVPSVPVGRHGDLHALLDADGGVRVFFATRGARYLSIASVRWDGTSFSALETLAEGAGASREPFALRDASDRIWLFFSRRAAAGGSDDTWSLRFRVFDPGLGAWGAEAALTAVLNGAADGEPSALLEPSGMLRVFFRSTRSGGRDVWSIGVDPATTTISAPVAELTGPMLHGWPALLAVPGDEPWLLYRSDQSIAPSNVGTRVPREPQNRVTSERRAAGWDQRASRRTEDTGTLTRRAGATSILRSHIDRTARRRRWDDLLSYTPVKPSGVPHEPPLEDHELYTRGTIGLFLSQTLPDSPLTQERVERLRPLLRKFLPIQTRAVVIIAPAVDIEHVYTPNADIGETYLDRYPDIETYTGLDDAAAVALPGWQVLLSTTATHVSADPTDLTTLRRRTFFRPFE